MINDQLKVISKPVSVSVAAGTSQPLNINAKFIFVDVMTSGGELWFVGERAEVRLIEGRQVRLPAEEVEIQLENRSGSDVNAVLLMGNVDVSDHAIVGTVSIGGTVTVAGAVDVNPDAVENIPTLRTTPYYRHSASAAMFTIVTPAANVNGVIISSMSALAGSGQIERIMAKETTPASYADATALSLDEVIGGSTFRQTAQIPLPILVPAGFGIYEASSSAGSNSAAYLTYEIL